MPDYTKGNIYKLCCNDTNIKDIYIGSTCNFTKRKHNHKTACNNEKCKNYNIYVYRFIRENGGWENWSMILVDEVCCENKKQLNQKEREWIEKLETTLNKTIPTRTKKEWTIEYMKGEKYKKYIKSEEHKNYNKEYSRKYRKTEKNKNYKKEWNKEYKKTDTYKNYQKKYKSQKVVCECGREVRKGSLSKHKKSNIHKTLMKEL